LKSGKAVSEKSEHRGDEIPFEPFGSANLTGMMSRSVHSRALCGIPTCFCHRASERASKIKVNRKTAIFPVCCRYSKATRRFLFRSLASIAQPRALQPVLERLNKQSFLAILPRVFPCFFLNLRKNILCKLFIPIQRIAAMAWVGSHVLKMLDSGRVYRKK
jgi:hypothetical protein